MIVDGFEFLSLFYRLVHGFLLNLFIVEFLGEALPSFRDSLSELLKL